MRPSDNLQKNVLSAWISCMASLPRRIVSIDFIGSVLVDGWNLTTHVPYADDIFELKIDMGALISITMEAYLKRIGKAIDKLIVIVYATQHVRHEQFWHMLCNQADRINIRIDECLQYVYEQGIDVSITESIVEHLTQSMDECITYTYADTDAVEDVGAFEDVSVFIMRIVGYYMQLCYVIRAL